MSNTSFSGPNSFQELVKTLEIIYSYNYVESLEQKLSRGGNHLPCFGGC